MAIVVNARDVLLQGATRLVPVTVGTSITWGGTVSGNVTGTIAGTSAATVRDGAANGTSALAGLSDKISKSATTITGSGFQQQSSGYASGTGYAYHDAGAIYKYGGETKLVIDLAGGVFAFKGDISGCNGTFAGNVNTAGSLKATGSVSGGGYQAAVLGMPAGVAEGVAGIANSSRSGVLGVNTSSGHAVKGEAYGSGAGVYGYNAGSGPGVAAYSATGVALQVAGLMTISSTQVVANLNADLLDGRHAGNAAGNVPVANGLTCVNLRAAEAASADNAGGLSGPHNSGLISGGCTVGTGHPVNNIVVFINNTASSPGGSGWSIKAPTGWLTLNVASQSGGTGAIKLPYWI